jgi:hypothetical protein
MRRLPPLPPGLSRSIQTRIQMESPSILASHLGAIERERALYSSSHRGAIAHSVDGSRDPRLANPASGILPQPKMCPGGAQTPRGADDTYRRGDDVSDRNRSCLDLTSGTAGQAGVRSVPISGPAAIARRSTEGAFRSGPWTVVPARRESVVTRDSRTPYIGRSTRR